jgi:hypothetical protein
MAQENYSTSTGTYKSSNQKMTKNSFQNENIQEGEVTKLIEKQTAKIPSTVYLGLAVGSMALSLTFAIFGGKSKGWANFVGQWAPSFLILGLYNKIVKTEGSDRTEAIH